jgi:aspartate-semialdehyde dehydrogenase
MSRPGVRIAVVGATGALGGEVLAALDASGLAIAELIPVATSASLGADVELRGEVWPVVAELPELRGLDLVVCCTPAAAALDSVRAALRAEVPCIDCSGSLADRDDVPLRVADLPGSSAGGAEPVVATPAGAVLAWSLALAPLHRAAGVRRVVGTVLETAGASGREGIASLSVGSLALFNQQELPDDAAAGRPLAFDCHASIGEIGADGRSAAERALEAGIRRLLGADIRVAATIAQVPAFVGQASALAIETQRPLDPKQAEDLLARASGVSLWTRGAEGPNLRAAAGGDRVLVGRVRSDPTVPGGLQLWLAADVLRLAAANAVALAVARLQPRH